MRVPTLDSFKRLEFVAVATEAESDNDDVTGTAGGPGVMLCFSLLFSFAAVIDAVGATADVVVSDVTPQPGSDAIVASVDTEDVLLLLLTLLFFFLLLRLCSLCLRPSPLLFGDDDEVVDVDVTDIAADVPSRRCNARV